jgi:hypothetical protein
MAPVIAKPYQQEFPMAHSITNVDVYAVDIMNRPGSLARVLEALASGGANLDFVIARQINENTSRVFVAPLKGAKQIRAASDVGLTKAKGMTAIRVTGSDKAGLGAAITRGIAAAGINIRGLSSGSIAKKNVCYIAFSSAEDAKRATGAIKKALK